MKTKPSVLVVLGLLIALAGGVWVYDWILGQTEEASEPIRALPIRENGPNEPDTTNVVERTGATFEIVPEASEVRFIIFEELRGEPVDVVGTTNQVAGQLLLDFDDLANSRLGTIRVNARTFVTDEERRDRATRNRILHTDDFEYIIFVPEEVNGLNGNLREGESVDFTIGGSLTIRDVTRPAVFEASITFNSPEVLFGEARTTVSRRDYDLVVPNLPFIANVADEVLLEFAGELRPVSDSALPITPDTHHDSDSPQ